MDPARHRHRGRAAADPGGGRLRRLPQQPGQRHHLGAHRRVDPRQRRQRDREHHRTVVVHEQPAADRRQADAIKTQKTVIDTTTSRRATTYPQIQHLPPPTARVATPAPSAGERGRVATDRTPGVGQPAVYTTYVRPDAVHTSYYTGLMWLDTKLLRANYVVGLEQPGGGPNPWGSQIPTQRDTAIAAFNSGLQDGLGQRRRLPRRPGDRAAARRLGVVHHQPGRLGQRRRVGPRLQHVARHQGGAAEPGADRRQRAAEPGDAGERHQRVRRHARQQRVRVALGRGRDRRRRARVRRRSGDVDHRPGPHAAGGGRGAGDGDGHQHRLGERVHLPAEQDGARATPSRASSCSTA